jgi:hypothetical protein
MKTLIFLDDDREWGDVTWVSCPLFDEVITVRNYDEFVVALMGCLHKMQSTWISLDHDIACYGKRVEKILGELHIVEGEIKGDYCCKVAIAEGFNPHQMIVHSRNPVGAANIQRAIDAAKEDWA